MGCICEFVAIALLSCPWPHPPTMEGAELIRASITQVSRSWDVKVCVTYRKRKKWCKGLGSFPSADEAWDAYRRWKLHVENVVHYDKGD